MDLYLSCDNCARSLVLRDADGEPDVVERILQLEEPECPSCRSGLRPTSKCPYPARLLSLSPTELYRAITGFGLPSEVEQTPASVERLLRTCAVAAVDFDTARPDLCLIRSITLQGGHRLHFTASGLGAVIFKVTKEHTDADDGV